MKIFRKNFSTINIKNVFKMKKVPNSRNKILNLNLKSCDYIFQTFWADFSHFTFASKKFENVDKELNGNMNNLEKLDITDYSNEENIVFQNENDFVDYEHNDSAINSMINFSSQENINIEESEFHNSKLLKEKLLISRIPQESNLDLKLEGNLKFINSGDTKLVADKYIKINLIGDSQKTVNFDTKRMRTEFFELQANDKILVINIKSYLEANKLQMSILNSSFIRIKKLGVVKEGNIKLNNSDCEIRSIYAPNKNSDLLKFEISNCKLQIGSIQGNLKFESKGPNQVTIENTECQNFEFLSTQDSDSQLEVFANSVISSFKIRGDQIKIILILNSEATESLGVLFNGQKLVDSNQDKFIDVQSSSKPDIINMTSWDYMKRKIERRISNKKNKQ